MNGAEHLQINKAKQLHNVNISYSENTPNYLMVVWLRSGKFAFAKYTQYSNSVEHRQRLCCRNNSLYHCIAVVIYCKNHNQPGTPRQHCRCLGKTTQFIKDKQHNRPLSIYLNSAWQRGIEDTSKGNWMSVFIHFFCLCPLGLTIKLIFYIESSLFIINKRYDLN